MSLNIELLKKVRDRIAQEPDRFDMCNWVTTDTEDSDGCGTAACIAGWAFVIHRKLEESPEEWFSRFDEYEVQCILGLKSDSIGSGLFHTKYWPEPYRSEYRDAADHAAESAVAVRLLDAVIEAGWIWWDDDEEKPE